MKSMMVNFGFFLMLIISSLIIVSVAKKQIIQEEMNEAMSVSIRNTMELWSENRALSEDELIQNFMMIFKTNINSASSYNLYFYEVDTENGMFDVEAEALFKYPNLREGNVCVRKTMVYDEKKH